MKRMAWTGVITAAALTVAGLGFAAPAIADPTALDAEEAAALTFSRDEERLARDLYTQLGELYPDAQVFGIAEAEQTHFEAVGTLLDRYGLDDPADGAEVGTYPGELQTLYDTWLAEGSTDVDAAYAVGIELEKRDIADLEAQLEDVDNADIERVLTNLLNGSEHHLAAFTAAAAGETVGTCDGTMAGDGQGYGRTNASDPNGQRAGNANAPRANAGAGMRGQATPGQGTGTGDCDGTCDGTGDGPRGPQGGNGRGPQQ